MTDDPPKLLIITGLSGAGMSSVLKTLEDLQFEAFDNFPLFLLQDLLRASVTLNSAMAIGIDSRSRGFNPDALVTEARKIGATVVFLTADDSVLERRFTETRRRHPLARHKTVSFGIAQERALLAPLRDAADLVIDTSDLSIHDLRHLLSGHFKLQRGQHVNIAVTSFSYRKGVPRQADFVFDVRFLKNPHWDPALRPLSGLDEAVGAAILQDSDFMPFMNSVTSLLEIILPRSAQEGKNYLTIAFGCSGGRHRSVYAAQYISHWLQQKSIENVIEHRDL
jgi:UPF0042 nucleotide-binding protein